MATHSSTLAWRIPGTEKPGRLQSAGRKESCTTEQRPFRQHIKKQRHYFASKGPSSQGLVFPVVTYGCESWTIKKAEEQKN